MTHCHTREKCQVPRRRSIGRRHVEAYAIHPGGQTVVVRVTPSGVVRLVG